MERLLQTHRFGPHRVDLLEHAGDEETTYVVLVDDIVVTDPPLAVAPRFGDVVRLYARWQREAAPA